MPITYYTAKWVVLVYLVIRKVQEQAGKMSFTVVNKAFRAFFSISPPTQNG
ncbi:MAG: hypothetical protein ACPGJS_13490 [Flammeovirgaceae bacterium]